MRERVRTLVSTCPSSIWMCAAAPKNCDWPTTRMDGTGGREFCAPTSTWSLWRPVEGTSGPGLRAARRRHRGGASQSPAGARLCQVDGQTGQDRPGRCPCLRDFADVLSRHQERQKYITEPVESHREELAALVMRRKQLVEMRVAEGTGWGRRARTPRSEHPNVIKTLDKQLADIDHDIDDMLEDTSRASARCWTASRAWAP